MTRAIKIQARVVGALLLREARVRHGRTQFGYLWAIVEPVFHVVILSALFSTFARQAPFGDSMGLFFATGVLPFHLYRNTAQYLGAAFEANKPLFNYPVIQQLDAVFARFLLELATWFIVVLIVMSFVIGVLDAPKPNDLAGILHAMAFVALFGFGLGLLNAVIRRKYNAWGVMFNVATSPLLFLSAVFYTLESIPSEFRGYLAWNPLVHGVEGFRTGYYLNYRSSALDLNYLMWCGLVCLCLGLLFERLTRAMEL